MLKNTVAIIFLCLFAIHVANGASDEFEMGFMQSVEDVSKDLASNLSVNDETQVSSNIQELKGMFAQIEEHYVKKGDAKDAVTITKNSRTVLEEIEKLVLARNFDAATEKSSEFSRHCKSCHKIYKP
jgi:hypothetical protein